MIQFTHFSLEYIQIKLLVITTFIYKYCNFKILGDLMIGIKFYRNIDSI